ncbi:hypothetical protein PT974_11564 [Cladobotryum mycophilum]|uniref:Uncharacterized protein n=1 Tax=Cladobotryum mycophilum TaxID=491253 RepID=A0ABR0S6F5_9HYPO
MILRSTNRRAAAATTAGLWQPSSEPASPGQTGSMALKRCKHAKTLEASVAYSTCAPLPRLQDAGAWAVIEPCINCAACVAAQFLEGCLGVGSPTVDETRLRQANITRTNNWNRDQGQRTSSLRSKARLITGVTTTPRQEPTPILNKAPKAHHTRTLA